MKRLFIIYFLLVAVISLASVTIINDKSKEINKLEKENNELKEENEFLKWQLNEVPTIIESRKGEICDEQNE